MAKWYSSFSILFLNTLLFAVLLLVLLWAVLGARHAITGRGGVIVSDALHYVSFGLTTNEKAKATGREFDDFASQQPMVFNPWTTFMLAPFEGKYLNVVSDPVLNHRLNGIASANEGKDRERLVVWGFGGSTLYGFGVPDDQTIPSHLQRILAEKYPAKLVEVVNFGQPYWFSSVEVAAYVALLRSGRKPDMVFFFDGLNDIAHLAAGRVLPFFAGRGNRAWERDRSDTRRLLPWFTVNESFPITRVIRFLQYKSLLKPKIGIPFDQTRRLDMAAAKQIFLNNLRTVKALSREFNVKPFFFLQPVPWYGEYKSTLVDKSFPFGDNKFAGRFYDEIISVYGRRSDATTLHDVLYDFKWPYVDNFHYSDTANKFIAGKIASAMGPAM